ncbi:MAG: hypothetical protein UR66_C0003G0031 [Candidatus Moranbacteria bacterium GW2011_GWE1_35_17]|nr:MAG: hypothetical protein UR66_C0003G0031 [Candidatus Moranbacteria bacterium GW2011_GWE1_35_17]KKP81437.1 MAG: hypothetical protein UR82_C0063G0006 [Candidatus Moranbacteria bacterium GW2011_GWF1_35_5]
MNNNIKNTEKYDVVIVGAGPAGSTAAFYTENLKVLIVDKFDFPRHKACGGGLMSSKDWSLELENYKRIKDELKSFSCKSIKMYWNKMFVAKCDFKHLFDQVSRYEFDELLLKEALKKENVKFLKFDLQMIEKKKLNGKDVFKLSDGQAEIETDYIIGADGMHSKVSKFLGNKNHKRHQFGYCMEYEINCEKKDLNVHVVAGYKWEIGYGWIFPTLNGYQVGIGIIRKPRKSLNYYLDDFLAWSSEKELIPKEYVIEKRFGGALPLKVVKNYCTDNILLCGDAMGLVKLLTGEGIYYAMKSGKAAGQTLTESQKDIKKRYKKKIKPLFWDTFLTPYVPPKIFTITFWSVFFHIGKIWNYFPIGNILVKFFIKMAIHRKSSRKDSYYHDEKIKIGK